MGIFDKIKSAFRKNSFAEPIVSIKTSREFDDIVTASTKEYARDNKNFWEAKVNGLAVYTEVVANWADKKKIAFIIYCVGDISEYNKNRRSFSSADPGRQANEIRQAYVTQLLRTKLIIDDEDLDQLVNAFSQNKKWDWATVNQWPIGPLLNQLVRQYGKSPLSPRMIGTLTGLKNNLSGIKDYSYEKERLKLIEKIDQLIFSASAAPDEVKPTLFLGEDRFSAFANQIIQSLTIGERQIWYKLIAKASKASGSKPSNKYLQESKDLFKELGVDKFKVVVNKWFVFVVDLKEVTTVHSQTYDNRVYNYSTSTFLSTVNVEAIKGFVWMCANFHDSTTLANLARLAERSYKKMPGVGPAAAAIGNACIYALYKSKGLDGIGHLSRLKLRIKQYNTQQAIEKYIHDAAKEQGVTTHQIEDMAVDDFKLINGARQFQFENFVCNLEITGTGKSEIRWFKDNGAEQKSVPAAIKDKEAGRLKKIKEIQKQVDQATLAQRDRIDRMFRADRKLDYQHFDAFFLKHGLMNFLTGKIIWTFKQEDNTTSSCLVNGKWLKNNDEEFIPDEGAEISLWHPALVSVNEVSQWREFLIRHQIQQPLKQAYREVYLLTEAELNTRSYSNRMAAHVLKQHQFNMLAKTRGWKYGLIGAYDNGVDNGTAEIPLPEYGLKGQYWVNEVNADDAFNDTGIWNYVTTDQVRFVRASDGEVVNLIDVPVLALSEVLRDIDLFVGVASIGNDPNWQDSGGITALNGYWASYSFGDLSELAKNRKELLSNLVPRLKIGKVASVQDKFLVVKGKLRTYKIHIGSTNILMEPNDQYLCIVPDRSQKSMTEGIFLPFEGDSGLSVILSKAFLLADDDKITDTTITSQINRK